MNEAKLKKFEEKVIRRLGKILSLHIFDEPRPNYVSHVTITDKLLAVTLLKFFPNFIRPNYLTAFRFIATPFLIYFLLQENYLISFWLFIVAVSTDALDGAIARTRNHITDWGIVFDPLADKLLIGSVSLIVISKFISPIMAGLIVAIEILLVISSYLRFRGEIVPAKTVGKIKMVLQSVGVFVLLLAIVTQLSILVSVSTGILCLAIFFGLLSLFVYRSI